MEIKELISIHQFCSHYNVPTSFVDELYDFELIEIIIQENERYIKITQINDLEKMIRLHFELDINLEGIDVVNNLLNQIKDLQNQVFILKNKLNYYDDSFS